VLDAKDADGALAADDRHPREAVEQFFARFGTIGKVGVRSGFVEVQRLDLVGDHADQPFAKAEARDMHRLLLQPARRIKLERAFAQQIDRADLAVEAFADNADDLVQLALRIGARCHDLVQPGQDGARRLGGRRGRWRGVGHRNPANRRMRCAPIPRARLSTLFLCGRGPGQLLPDGTVTEAVGPTAEVGAGVFMIAGFGAYFASHATAST